MALTMPTIESAPTFDGQAVPDETDWQAVTLALAKTGVVSGGLVTQHTGSDMAINTAALSVLLGGVPYSLGAQTGIAIAAAGTYDRRDIVVFTPGIGIETSGSGTTNSTACTGTLCGTAGWTHSSSGNPPVKPAIPAGSILLGEPYVAATTTAIVAGNLTDKTTLISEVTAYRQTVVHTTASLALNAVEQSSVVMAKTWRLLSVTTSQAARVRLYDTAAAQGADVLRAIGTLPQTSAGVMFEFVSTALVLSAATTPQASGSSMETIPSTSIPITVTNLGSTAAVTVTLVFQALE